LWRDEQRISAFFGEVGDASLIEANSDTFSSYAGKLALKSKKLLAFYCRTASCKRHLELIRLPLSIQNNLKQYFDELNRPRTEATVVYEQLRFTITSIYFFQDQNYRKFLGSCKVLDGSKFQ